MSNALVISAVTATLRKIIQDALNATVPGIQVTTEPLDRARTNNRNDNQVNVYLYHTVVNAGWSNLDMPNRVKPGEIGFPPLPLNLYYLVTAYAENNDEVRANGLLGAAMSILHDTPVLDPADIRTALPMQDTPGEQIERVRVTHEPLSVEEISKLWAAFQTNYRLSAAYQVSVVLIESLRAGRASLPVLRRGEEDKGVTTLTAFPALESLRAIAAGTENTVRMGGALPGDTVILRGTGLQAANLSVRLLHPHLPAPLELVPVVSSETEIRVILPADAPDDWPPGYYSVGVIVRLPASSNIVYSSNELMLPVMPEINQITPNPAPLVGGEVTLTIEFEPSVWPSQRVALLLGDQEVPAPALPTVTDSITFTATRMMLGQFYVRLRVDGIDSSLIDPNTMPPQFDQSKRVTVQ